jgi:HEAT repeat protein/thiamine kinase-like enzyme
MWRHGREFDRRDEEFDSNSIDYKLIGKIEFTRADYVKLQKDWFSYAKRKKLDDIPLAFLENSKAIWCKDRISKIMFRKTLKFLAEVANVYSSPSTNLGAKSTSSPVKLSGEDHEDSASKLPSRVHIPFSHLYRANFSINAFESLEFLACIGSSTKYIVPLVQLLMIPFYYSDSHSYIYAFLAAYFMKTAFSFFLLSFITIKMAKVLDEKFEGGSKFVREYLIFLRRNGIGASADDQRDVLNFGQSFSLKNGIYIVKPNQLVPRAISLSFKSGLWIYFTKPRLRTLWAPAIYPVCCWVAPLSGWDKGTERLRDKLYYWLLRLSPKILVRKPVGNISKVSGSILEPISGQGASSPVALVSTCEEIIEHLRWMKDAHVDEVPDEILHSRMVTLEGDHFKEDKRGEWHKVRKSWFVGVNCDLANLLEDGFITDLMLVSKIKSFFNKFCSIEFSTRLTTTEDIREANELIYQVLGAVVATRVSSSPEELVFCLRVKNRIHTRPAYRLLTVINIHRNCYVRVTNLNRTDEFSSFEKIAGRELDIFETVLLNAIRGDILKFEIGGKGGNKLAEAIKNLEDLDKEEKIFEKADFASSSPVGNDDQNILAPEVISETIAEKVRKMPAWELLSVLDLKKAEWLLGKSGPRDLTIRRIRVPKLRNKHKAPEGLSILPYELFDTTEFELLYNKEGYLIAVYPVLPNGFLIKSDERCPRYFDFSEYYFRIPEFGDPEMIEKWAAFAKDVDEDRKTISAYEDLVGIRDKFERRPRWVSYIYVNLDYRDNFPYAQAFYINKFGYMVERGEVLNKLSSDIIQSILPVFPTVYHPGSHLSDDWKYILAVVRRLDIQEGHDVLVVGPGNGLDTWFVSRQTKQKIYVAGINPFEVANTRAVAKIAGFKIEAMIHDNIISEEGMPVFNKKFDRIIWNMPTYYPVASRIRESLEEWEDDDYEGMTFKRFARGLPSLLKPEGFALVWNSAPEKLLDGAKEILKAKGMLDVTAEKYPGMTCLANMEMGTETVPTALYFIRKGKEPDVASVYREDSSSPVAQRASVRPICERIPAELWSAMELIRYAYEEKYRFLETRPIDIAFYDRIVKTKKGILAGKCLFSWQYFIKKKSPFHIRLSPWLKSQDREIQAQVIIHELAHAEFWESNFLIIRIVFAVSILGLLLNGINSIFAIAPALISNKLSMFLMVCNITGMLVAMIDHSYSESAAVMAESRFNLNLIKKQLGLTNGSVRKSASSPVENIEELLNRYNLKDVGGIKEIEAKNGWSNKVYIITAVSGKYVLKSFPGATLDQEKKIINEYSVTSHLISNGIEADEIIKACGTHIYLKDKNQTIHTLRKFIYGKSMTYKEVLNKEIRDRVAKLQAQVHNAMEHFDHSRWRPFNYQNVRTIYNDFEDRNNDIKIIEEIRKGLAEKIKRSRELLTPTEELFMEEHKFIIAQINKLRRELDELKVTDLPYQVIHGDFDPTNILIIDEKRLAIFDWDYLRLGPEIFDLTGSFLNRVPSKPGADLSKYRFDLRIVRDYISTYQSYRNRKLTAQEIKAVPTMYLAGGIEFLFMIRNLLKESFVGDEDKFRHLNSKLIFLRRLNAIPDEDLRSCLDEIANSVSSPVGLPAAKISGSIKHLEGLDSFERRSIRWFGRKAVLDLDNNHVVMIKFAHQQDDGHYNPADISALEREARNMNELPFLSLIPLLGEDRNFVYNFRGKIYGPAIKTSNSQGRYPAISFIAPRDSQVYLTQNFSPDKRDDIKNAALACAGQLGYLIARGKYHSTLLPMTHRGNAWNWDFSTIGSFEIKPEDIMYPNLTLGGIIDLEHVFPIPAHEYAYAQLVVLNKAFLRKVLLNRSLESWFGQQWSELSIATIASGVINKLKQEEILEILGLCAKAYFSSSTGKAPENLLTQEGMGPIVNEMVKMWPDKPMKIRVSDYAALQLSASVQSLADQFTQTEAFASLTKIIDNVKPAISSSPVAASSWIVNIMPKLCRILPKYFPFYFNNPNLIITKDNFNRITNNFLAELLSLANGKLLSNLGWDYENSERSIRWFEMSLKDKLNNAFDALVSLYDPDWIKLRAWGILSDYRGKVDLGIFFEDGGLHIIVIDSGPGYGKAADTEWKRNKDLYFGEKGSGIASIRDIVNGNVKASLKPMEFNLSVVRGLKGRFIQSVYVEERDEEARLIRFNLRETRDIRKITGYSRKNRFIKKELKTGVKLDGIRQVTVTELIIPQAFLKPGSSSPIRSSSAIGQADTDKNLCRFYRLEMPSNNPTPAELTYKLEDLDLIHSFNGLEPQRLQGSGVITGGIINRTRGNIYAAQLWLKFSDYPQYRDYLLKAGKVELILIEGRKSYIKVFDGQGEPMKVNAEPLIIALGKDNRKPGPRKSMEEGRRLHIPERLKRLQEDFDRTDSGLNDDPDQNYNAQIASREAIYRKIGKQIMREGLKSHPQGALLLKRIKMRIGSITKSDPSKKEKKVREPAPQKSIPENEDIIGRIKWIFSPGGKAGEVIAYADELIKIAGENAWGAAERAFTFVALGIAGNRLTDRKKLYSAEQIIYRHLLSPESEEELEEIDYDQEQEPDSLENFIYKYLLSPELKDELERIGYTFEVNFTSGRIKLISLKQEELRSVARKLMPPQKEEQAIFNKLTGSNYIREKIDKMIPQLDKKKSSSLASSPIHRRSNIKIKLFNIWQKSIGEFVNRLQDSNEIALFFKSLIIIVPVEIYILGEMVGIANVIEAAFYKPLASLILWFIASFLLYCLVVFPATAVLYLVNDEIDSSLSSATLRELIERVESAITVKQIRECPDRDQALLAKIGRHLKAILNIRDTSPMRLLLRCDFKGIQWKFFPRKLLNQLNYVAYWKQNLPLARYYSSETMFLWRSVRRLVNEKMGENRRFCPPRQELLMLIEAVKQNEEKGSSSPVNLREIIESSQKIEHAYPPESLTNNLRKIISDSPEAVDEIITTITENAKEEFAKLLAYALGIVTRDLNLITNKIIVAIQENRDNRRARELFVLALYRVHGRSMLTEEEIDALLRIMEEIGDDWLFVCIADILNQAFSNNPESRFGSVNRLINMILEGKFRYEARRHLIEVLRMNILRSDQYKEIKDEISIYINSELTTEIKNLGYDFEELLNELVFQLHYNRTVDAAFIEVQEKYSKISEKSLRDSLEGVVDFITEAPFNSEAQGLLVRLGRIRAFRDIYKILEGEAYLPGCVNSGEQANKKPYLDLASGILVAENFLTLPKNRTYIFVDRSDFVVAYLDQVKEILGLDNIKSEKADIFKMDNEPGSIGSLRLRLRGLYIDESDIPEGWPSKIKEWMATGGEIIIEFSGKKDRKKLADSIIETLKKELKVGERERWLFKYGIFEGSTFIEGKTGEYSLCDGDIATTVVIFKSNLTVSSALVCSLTIPPPLSVGALMRTHGETISSSPVATYSNAGLESVIGANVATRGRVSISSSVTMDSNKINWQSGKELPKKIGFILSKLARAPPIFTIFYVVIFGLFFILSGCHGVSKQYPGPKINTEERSVASYNKENEFNAKSPSFYSSKGFLYAIRGEFEAARESFKKTLELEPRFVLDLINNLKSNNVGIRYVCLWVLSEARIKETVESIINMYNTDKDINIRRYALVALSNFEHPLLEEVFIKGVENDDDFMRHLSMIELTRRGIGSRNFINFIIDISSDETYGFLKPAAIFALSVKINDYPSVVAPIQKALKDSNELVRQAAVLGLSNLKNSDTAKIIEENLSDSSAKVRQAVAFSLGVIANPISLPPLRTLIKDKDPLVRQEAIASFAYIPGAQISELTPYLSDKNWEVRYMALKIVGKSDKDRYTDFVIPRLKDESWQVRESAAAFLGKFNKPEVVKSLIPLLRDDNTYVRQAVVLSLGDKVKVYPQLPKEFINILKVDSDPWAKYIAALSLQSVNTPEVEKVRLLIRQIAPEVRVAVISPGVDDFDMRTPGRELTQDVTKDWQLRKILELGGVKVIEHRWPGRLWEILKVQRDFDSTELKALKLAGEKGIILNIGHSAGNIVNERLFEHIKPGMNTPITEAIKKGRVRIVSLNSPSVYNFSKIDSGWKNFWAGNDPISWVSEIFSQNRHDIKYNYSPDITKDYRELHFGFKDPRVISNIVHQAFPNLSMPQLDKMLRQQDAFQWKYFPTVGSWPGRYDFRSIAPPDYWKQQSLQQLNMEMHKVYSPSLQQSGSSYRSYIPAPIHIPLPKINPLPVYKAPAPKLTIPKQPSYQPPAIRIRPVNPPSRRR